MVSQKVFTPFVLTVMMVFLYSCTDSDIQAIDDFEILQDEVQIGEGMYSFINIKGGNKDFTYTVEDEEIAEITYHPGNIAQEGATILFEDGVFILKGLTKGETAIRIKDNINGQEETVSVSVTEGYVTLRTEQTDIEIVYGDEDTEEEIKAIIREEHLFTGSAILTLINREENNFHFFDLPEDMEDGMGPYPGMHGYHEITLAEEGSEVIISYEDHDYIFSLKFHGDTKHRFTEIFGINFQAKEKADNFNNTEYRKSPYPWPEVYMTRDVTDLYKSDYPDLTRATIVHTTRLIMPFYPVMIDD